MSDDAEVSTRAVNSIGGGLQFERTALAWERTAIAMMVAGIALARTAASRGYFVFSALGVVQTFAGGLLLLWAGKNDDVLHGSGDPASVPQVALTRAVGMGTVAFSLVTLASALIFAA